MITNTITAQNIQTHSHHSRKATNQEQTIGQFSSTSVANNFPPDLLQNMFKLILSLLSQLKNKSEQKSEKNSSTTTAPKKHSPVDPTKEKPSTAKTPSELNINKAQKQHLINAIFPQFKEVTRSDDTIEIAKITDSNHDGKLSAGDTIKIIHDNGEAPAGLARRVETHKLTQGEWDSYLKSTASEGKVTQAKVPTELFPVEPFKQPTSSLNLSDGEKKRLSSAIIAERYNFTRPANADPKAMFGFSVSDEVTQVTGVIDNNKDGKLSVGDTIKLVITNGEGPGSPKLKEHKLTQREFNRYHNDGSANPRSEAQTAHNIYRSESISRYGNELPVTEEQQKNTLSEVFGFIARHDDNIRIHDKDGIIKVGEGSGIIKAGDTAVLYSSRRIADKNTVIARLTQENVLDIQHGKAVPLSNEQHQRTLENFFTASDSDKVRISDKNGDSKVSAGDTALLYSPSRIENRTTIVSTLSESDARKVNGE